ncbi:hypothetical protein TeGR_g9968 [Tetraparma gracilis]|uniref:RING-type domain-containing protein n=1 Tax=Tetraparma gracilis TaxID=2962635 RepID=A0ABQ6MYI8_9STRA|nr:hypothetical protein TeGR_g9968 [Tetraparma gracilis]
MGSIVSSPSISTPQSASPTRLVAGSLDRHPPDANPNRIIGDGVDSRANAESGFEDGVPVDDTGEDVVAAAVMRATADPLPLGPGDWQGLGEDGEPLHLPVIYGLGHAWPHIARASSLGSWGVGASYEIEATSCERSVCRICYEDVRASPAHSKILRCGVCVDVSYHARCAGEEWAARCVQCECETMRVMSRAEVMALGGPKALVDPDPTPYLFPAPAPASAPALALAPAPAPALYPSLADAAANFVPAPTYVRFRENESHASSVICPQKKWLEAKADEEEDAEEEDAEEEDAEEKGEGWAWAWAWLGEAPPDETKSPPGWSPAQEK